MERSPALRVIIAAIVYLALYPLASASGLIHPACYAYVGTLVVLPFAFVYLWTASTMVGFGAAAVLNGFVLAVGLIVGEGNWAFVVGMVVLALLAEAIRAWCGYDTWRGVYLSFIPFAYSFYAYSAHWWTDTSGSLAAAVEEMPAGYADKMAPVIANTPMLVFMLLLVVPVAILSMRLADVALASQTSSLR